MAIPGKLPDSVSLDFSADLLGDCTTGIPFGPTSGFALLAMTYYIAARFAIIIAQNVFSLQSLCCRINYEKCDKELSP